MVNVGGGGSLLSDRASSVKDIRLIGSAIRNGWDIPDETRQALPKVLSDMALDAMEDPKARIAAARVLVAMHGQNQRDSSIGTGVTHRHVHELGQITADNLEQRKAEIASRITGSVEHAGRR